LTDTSNSKDKELYAIICNHVTKIYDSRIAVDNVNINIKYGSIFGLLGPNGAGKTTIIKMLTGLSTPTKGEAYVAGYNITKNAVKVKENIGWISSEVILDDSLNSMENIWIQSKLHDLGKDWKQKAISIMKYFDLDETNQTKVGKFSTGMRKKLEITMALVHNPKILFMDEPTIGLDVNTRRLLWNLIKKINKSYGVTILLTTHYIEEADALCDSLAIINHGKIIATGSTQELKSLVGGDILEIDFFSLFDFSIIKNIDGVNSILNEEIFNSEEITQINNPLKLFIKVNNAETILPKLISIINLQHPNIIKSIRIEKPSLETIFLELTGMSFTEAQEKSQEQNFNNIKSS